MPVSPYLKVVGLLASFGGPYLLAEGRTLQAACNQTECSSPQFGGAPTTNPTAPVGVDQYDPSVVGPTASNTPWQIHLLPGASQKDLIGLWNMQYG